jgi:antitoxin (DNA-binding transcriptional repressor) of toxin-antitoxin stability system
LPETIARGQDKYYSGTMEMRVSSREAAASLEVLLDRVNGEGDTVVVIERDGHPVAKLVPVRPQPGPGMGRDFVRLLQSLPKGDDGWADAVEEAVRLGNQPVVPESPWDR